MSSNVFIASLTAGGIVTTSFANTLSSSISAIVDFKANWRFFNVDGADVVIGRNLLINAFLEDKSFDRILFIDSDMLVKKKVLERMLARNADIVGAVYTSRDRDWNRLYSSIESGSDSELAVAESSNFNVHLIPGPLTVENGFCKLAAFGFGYVLIKRQLLIRMIESHVVEPLVCNSIRKAGITGEMYDFFGLLEKEDGDKLSEDYSFCKRVTNLGNTDLLAYVGKGISHTGQFNYDASFVKWLESR